MWGAHEQFSDQNPSEKKRIESPLQLNLVASVTYVRMTVRCPVIDILGGSTARKSRDVATDTCT